MEPESIRGRSWADVADEVAAEEAELAEMAARCAPPASPTLGDFLQIGRASCRERVYVLV